MPTLSLRLIPTAATLPVLAGYLPGSDTAAWLEEMARHPRARFFVVPSSVEAAEAGGLLIWQTKDAKFGLRVLPCGIEHGSVVVPCDTRLDPALTADEARRLLNYPVYFFHPALGLVAFEETDAITPERLIVPPLARDSSWMSVRPGNAPTPRLTRVSLILPEEPDALFGDAASEIGLQSPKDLNRESPLFDRLKDKLIGGAALAGMGAVGALGALAAFFGGKSASNRPGNSKAGSANTRGIPLMDKILDWTADQIEKLAKKRQQELDRLMKLLESNPELGLRYALPFSDGGDAARGTAPPSWKLGERNPIFGSHRGGGPADVWSLAPQTQWQLQQKYRDLANREIAAGRFDRAAYIFAELLGDWHNAAATLARGKRHQEAARIYLTKLNNKVQAAKCLEDGGLLADAVLLYAELAQHEKCGDLLRQLGRECEAVAAYQAAIQGGGDRLNDARILFEKLQQHGLALSVLASGYPGSSQAAECLERQFDYFARLEATVDALTLAHSLSSTERQMPDRLKMIETLRRIHQTQPEPEVRGRLSVVALSVIGDALAAGGVKEEPLLAALPQFAPSDLLLKRDAQRYGTILDQKRRESRKGSHSREAVLMLSHQSTIKLPQDGTIWDHLISQGDKWLAIGKNERTRQDVWVLGKGNSSIGKLVSAAGWQYQTSLLPMLSPVREQAWLPYGPTDGEVRYGLANKADFASCPNTRQMLIDRLVWIPKRVLAAHAQADGVWIVHHNVTDTIDLSFYTLGGQMMRTHALGWAPPELTSLVCIAAHGDHVMLSAGTHLLRIKNGIVINQSELAGS
ncbi:MAG: hypothetical protein H7A54_09520 [Akkermansiaceae bacterium]|nr:hypothetical protein [Akkermansiaceae bacterium]